MADCRKTSMSVRTMPNQKQFCSRKMKKWPVAYRNRQKPGHFFSLHPVTNGCLSPHPLRRFQLAFSPLPFMNLTVTYEQRMMDPPHNKLMAGLGKC
jgi:hypothetical protein